MRATWSYAVSCPKPRSVSAETCSKHFKTSLNHGMEYVEWDVFIYIYIYMHIYIHNFQRNHDKFMCTVVAICQNASSATGSCCRSQEQVCSFPLFQVYKLIEPVTIMIPAPVSCIHWFLAHYIWQQKRHVLLYDIIQKWAIQAKSHIIGYSMI